MADTAVLLEIINYIFQRTPPTADCDEPLIVSNLQVWNFPQGLKNELETVVVNEPSVFEPLKVYCNHSEFY